MAQHLCIVARNQPLLMGYLNIVLEHLSADGDDLQIVIDRRPDLLSDRAAVSTPAGGGRGPAAYPRGRAASRPRLRHRLAPDGMSWQLNDHGAVPTEEVPTEELDSVDELVEADAHARSGPSSHVGVSALAITRRW